jgi:hypothetical protein
MGVLDDLRSVVLLAVVEAEQSYDPEGGRTLFAWVWINAEWAASKFLRHEAYRSPHAGGEVVDAVYDPTTTILVRNAMEYLRAKLGSADWALLWLRRAEGHRLDTLARQAGILPCSMSTKISEIERQAAKILRAGGIVGGYG